MNDLVANIRNSQQIQWKAGQRVRVESYLQQYAHQIDHNDEMTIDLIYSELLMRKNLGETVSVEEYYSRFPDYADQIRRQVEFEANLETNLTCEGDSGGAEPLGGTALPPTETTLPGYKLLEIIGQGARGIVYRARQIGVNRDVALKLVKENSPNERLKLRREAEIASCSDHPNIVHIYDCGEYEGGCFLAMEFAPSSLDKRLKQGPFKAIEAASLIEKLARALNVVHSQRIVHRDLKPANVLLKEDGTPKIADFGVAKKIDKEDTLGGSGAIIGSAAYMSPEQADGKNREIEPAADLHALGIILHELLTGEILFHGANLIDTLKLVRSKIPAPLPRSICPRDLDTIRLKCLEKNPKNRYVTALQLADDLRKFQDGQEIDAKPRNAAVRSVRLIRRRPFEILGALAASLFFAVAAIAFFQPNPDRKIEDLERRLANGKKITLIPERGAGPIWLNVLTGPDEKDFTKLADGQFEVSNLSHRPLLLELIRKIPGDNIRIRAEVQQTACGAEGNLGLFFRCRGSEKRRDFLDVNFTDINPKIINDASPKARERQPVEIFAGSIIQQEELSDSVWNPQVPLGKAGEHYYLGKQTQQWRKITIEILRNEYRIGWDDEFLKSGTISKSRVRESFQNRRPKSPFNEPSLEEELSQPIDFGIYLYSAVARFRSFTLEPLGE